MSDTPPGRPQVWACTVAPGKIVRLPDVPITDYIEIQSRFTIDWGEFYYSPRRNAAVALAIYEKCCARAGIPCPADVSAGTVIDAFDLVDDDVPYSFTDGLPDPTPAGALATHG